MPKSSQYRCIAVTLQCLHSSFQCVAIICRHRRALHRLHTWSRSLQIVDRRSAVLGHRGPEFRLMFLSPVIRKIARRGNARHDKHAQNGPQHSLGPARHSRLRLAVLPIISLLARSHHVAILRGGHRRTVGTQGPAQRLRLGVIRIVFIGEPVGAIKEMRKCRGIVIQSAIRGAESIVLDGIGIIITQSGTKQNRVTGAAVFRGRRFVRRLVGAIDIVTGRIALVQAPCFIRVAERFLKIENIGLARRVLEVGDIELEVS